MRFKNLLIVAALTSVGFASCDALEGLDQEIKKDFDIDISLESLSQKSANGTNSIYTFGGTETFSLESFSDLKDQLENLAGIEIDSAMYSFSHLPEGDTIFSLDITLKYAPGINSVTDSPTLDDLISQFASLSSDQITSSNLTLVEPLNPFTSEQTTGQLTAENLAAFTTLFSAMKTHAYLGTVLFVVDGTANFDVMNYNVPVDLNLDLATTITISASSLFEGEL